MKAQRAKRVKVGDLYAIPLPNGKYAFGRVYNDAGIAIYKHIADRITDTPTTEDYQFVVGVYRHVLNSGNWVKIGNRDFGNPDDAWPPPSCRIDPITGTYSIYYKGEFRPASKEECRSMEIASVWDENHIVDRIMGETKWHEKG